ncbi:class I SAM-dependent methyltransferase [Winogradskyella immobilis]|uniref:RsmD family RNA methyltransferase n=1 Tax=Winogradskyella immobilis TaxID=2816852 RepID=A0ABS8ELV7_9FLAO|nr:class I SAM-dependent methyltransferase [Winogradskyella immobilis]MCC1484199.1 RsmD family RNA methyltransferase [Winogradskyella immobilis]MCG0016291.1 RsmD family RNA methyltransferase [Winogradskyella immobilis]
MNLKLLNTDIQTYITENLNVDVSKLILKGSDFEGVDHKLIIEQIEAKKRCKKKLPTWFSNKNIYYPNKLNIEQTSSELTASYKANLVSGKTLIDITGGFGVDCYYFSKQIDTVTHCEINTKLSKIVKHNYKTLNANNIKSIANDGLETLEALNQSFDWIYIDPSRRDDIKNKVFLLTDCQPNIKNILGLLFIYSKNVMLKTSPLLDISATLKDLKYVKEIHCIAVNNEMKELLWVLQKDYNEAIEVKTINIQKNSSQTFNFLCKEEGLKEAFHSKASNYIYEPNSAILKSGAFNILSNKLNIYKLHKHSHLYTSDALIEFPGRRFSIDTIIPYNKKEFLKLKVTKANITIRNFPLSVNDIRKKLKIKDGGDIYLFFTTNNENKRVILKCSKL